MTDEPGQDRATPRRKFDDVASLFGTIVPAPGAIPRRTDNFPPPLAPQEPPPPPPAPAVSVSEIPPRARPPQPETGRALQRRPEPPPRPRPRPTEVPWPDAFEPRPNFRRRDPRNWSWLLLIPVGFVAAVGITMLDPRSIRNWLDTNVLHRNLVPATTTAPLLSTPTPEPPPPLSTVPPALPPPLPTVTPTPAPTPPAELPAPYPALPTSPVPVPPGTEVSPPPAYPSETPPAPAVPTRITIQYRRNIPGSDGEARRIAALLQSYGGSIELHPNATTVRVPTIYYYNNADKAAANSLAAALANEAINWAVRAGTTKNPPGSLEVWLP